MCKLRLRDLEECGHPVSPLQLAWNAMQRLSKLDSGVGWWPCINVKFSGRSLL